LLENGKPFLKLHIIDLEIPSEKIKKNFQVNFKNGFSFSSNS
jgi:hypothetical protein